jgi:hypothetical protein
MFYHSDMDSDHNNQCSSRLVPSNPSGQVQK